MDARAMGCSCLGFEGWVIEAEPIQDLISVGLISSWPELGHQAQVWPLGFQIKNTNNGSQPFSGFDGDPEKHS